MIAQIESQEVRFTAPERWLDQAINVVVLGAGGNGSEVVDCLATFHFTLLKLGHPHGLNVTVIDDAVVRESNLVRQRFWPCDIDQYKSICLVNRYNLNLGTQWKALPYRFPGEQTIFSLANADLVISCVDVNSARVALANYQGKLRKDAMWMDMGNGQRHGQVVFGGLTEVMRKRFPCVLDVYPEVAGLADSTTKSCSAAESINSQDCLVNRSVATAAMSLLWELIRSGSTAKHWILLSLESGEQQTHKFPEA